MRRVTVAACVALCLMGSSALALADEGERYGDQQKSVGDGALYGDQLEPARTDDAMKGKEKAQKKKMKTHKEGTKIAPGAPAPAVKP